MSEDNELLDALENDAPNFTKFRGLDWPAMSPSEFEYRRAQVFHTMKGIDARRRVAKSIREIDREAEIARRAAAEESDDGS